MKTLNISEWTRVMLNCFNILLIGGVLYCCSADHSSEPLAVKDVIIAQHPDIAALAKEMGLNINLEDDYFNMQLTIEEWKILFERAQKVLSVIDTVGRENYISFCDVLATRGGVVPLDSLYPPVEDTTTRDTSSVCQSKSGNCRYSPIGNMDYSLDIDFSWVTPTPCEPGVVGGSINLIVWNPNYVGSVEGASFIWYGVDMFKYTFTIMLKSVFPDNTGKYKTIYEYKDVYIHTESSSSTCVS